MKTSAVWETYPSLKKYNYPSVNTCSSNLASQLQLGRLLLVNYNKVHSLLLYICVTRKYVYVNYVLVLLPWVFMQGQFEDTKGVIRSRQSKMDTILWPKENRQAKGQTVIYKIRHRQLNKDWATTTKTTTEDEPWRSGKVGSSCSTISARRGILVWIKW